MTRKKFHPGVFIADYLEDLEMTQDEFAKRLGISPKQLSLIINGNASITIKTADMLSNVLDTSIDFWLNLQNSYDKYLLTLQENITDEIQIYKMIDSSFLKKMKIINDKCTVEEKLSELRKQLQVASLTNLSNPDLYVQLKSVKNEVETNNIVCRNVWITLALANAKKIETKVFNDKLLLSKIQVFKEMTKLSVNEFFPNLTTLLSECGVSLVVLPNLKNSMINGATKWINDEKVMLALNTRGVSSDKFWFSFFHELKHVLQRKKKSFTFDNEIFEQEADEFARNTLIPVLEYNNFIKETITKKSIIEFAQKINIHEGIVVGRLQKDQVISYNKFNELKSKYIIDFN